MKFLVMKEIPTELVPDTLYLLKGVIYRGGLDDSWNDYGYRTRYTLLHCDSPNNRIEIGVVKLGEFKMGENQATPNLPLEFTSLSPDEFFSLGANEDYYRRIVDLESGRGYEILLALNDFTLCNDVYVKAKEEDVTIWSLLRDIGKDNYDNHIQEFYELLRPPLNLNTMRRIFGSTGWDDIDHGLLVMQQLLYGANNHLYYNAIATIGREVLKGIAGKLYDDDVHRNKDKFPLAPTEDKFINKLHGVVDYLSAEGEIADNLKSYIKSTIELVQGYVHKEEAEGFEGFMCVHAVVALAFQLSIICRKDKYNKG